jgi:FtsZ-binding cell division protein ZapB
MKMLGKYLFTPTPKEKIPTAIRTALERICKECDRVPLLEMEIKELKTNLNIVELSKKAKKGQVSPAHDNMLREANSSFTVRIQRAYVRR